MPPDARKEISCQDCGHVYVVSLQQQSSRCGACGNIAFHAEERNPQPKAATHFALPEGWRVSSTAARRKTPAKAPPKTVDDSAAILERFRTTPDGHTVQDYLVRYQVEWQLWAKLVQNFSDPALHGAYLARITHAGSFEEASARYRDHRSVMALSPETHWQAEVAELMLSRVETLAALRMEQAGSDGFRLPTWLYLLPLQSRPFRIAWFTLGLLAMARLFRMI